jgi:N-acetylmuramoyl-L-alanine amidase
MVRPAGAAPLQRDVLPLVILDPGHGGKDPGAVGFSGTYEKHIAFAAARELQRQLIATGRMRVELTRTRDVFVPLESRVAMAERKAADLFVSIHADAMSDRSVRGASVYTLGEHPSDPQSASLARRENGADGAERLPQAASPEVARILASLVREETRAGSIRLAQDVVGALGEETSLLPKPQRRADFAVLAAADIPSVLVEMGFMSNREDEAALRDPDHRERLAAAITRAISAYFGALPSA